MRQDAGTIGICSLQLSSVSLAEVMENAREAGTGSSGLARSGSGFPMNVFILLHTSPWGNSGLSILT